MNYFSNIKQRIIDKLLQSAYQSDEDWSIFYTFQFAKKLHTFLTKNFSFNSN